jgi:hypothetical protein
MSETFFLFARPSFLEGIARVLDLGNTLREYNDSQSTAEADLIAIGTDWSAIGRDIENSIMDNSEKEDVKEK